MKIGVDIRELQRGLRTGIGRMVEAVITEAPNIRDNINLALYSDQTTRTELPAKATECRTLPQPATLWFDQVALPKALADDHVDIFWSPYYKAPFFSPCPKTITIHDLLFLAVGGRRFKNALFKPWARLIGCRAARVITDSEHSRRDIERILGLDPSRIEVVPLGVSNGFSPHAREQTPQLLRRLGITAPYVLTVTNFRRHKNDGLLVRAFARVASHHPSVSLVLAGKPAHNHRSLLELIEQLDLSGRVHLPGLISDEDLPALYAGAELFAFPSIYEGFGLPILEAMACGTAVVSASSSSLPEIAEGAAVLLPPTDVDGWHRAMNDLLANEDQRKKWTHTGLERAKAFTWRRSVEKILDVLESTVA
jgi:glycosyltransferase involved in cell wall biosynthesis